MVNQKGKHNRSLKVARGDRTGAFGPHLIHTLQHRQGHFASGQDFRIHCFPQMFSMGNKFRAQTISRSITDDADVLVEYVGKERSRS
jgi:hypothetical protein